MKFTVVTPVLNGAAFLPATLKSMRDQTWENFEHIIIDAGSDDGSAEICDTARRADARVKFLSHPGEPLYQSIFAGFAEASGDMLSWLNADDLYAPWALATAAQFVEAHHGVEWLTGLPGCWDEAGRLRFVRPEGLKCRALIRAGWHHRDLLGFLQQESMFFTRRLFERLSDEEKAAIAGAAFAGDFMLWKRLARHAPLATAPTVFGGFRRHGKNLSSRNEAAYMAEVRQDGAVFFPPVVREAVQYVHGRLSALRARKLALMADAGTQRSLSR